MQWIFFILVSFTTFAQQRLPLSVKAGEACHIAEASPLLSAEAYAKNNYSMKVLQESRPRQIQEEIVLANTSLRIVQRGCEDIRVKFHFEYDTSDKKILRRSIDLLNSLKTSEKGLINPVLYKSVMKKLAEAYNRFKDDEDMNRRVICVSGDPKEECFTDFDVRFQGKQVDITYVDRP